VFDRWIPFAFGTRASGMEVSLRLLVMFAVSSMRVPVWREVKDELAAVCAGEESCPKPGCIQMRKTAEHARRTVGMEARRVDERSSKDE